MIAHNEKNFQANMPICVACPKRQQQCAGACPCTMDGKDIIEHANEGYCPIGSYHMGTGDWLARVFHRTGVKALVNKATGGDCGCKGRQMAWNKQPDEAGK